MTLVRFANGCGIVVVPFNWHTENTGLGSASQINAVGESSTYIGQAILTSGPGTSKVISSAGGSIWFYPTGLTWASASTTVRVGIQDVNTGTGIEDGTFDVYDDLVPGTDTIVANTIKQAFMSNGTKTITYGDTIAISIEMLARGGTDLIQINQTSNISNFPYLTQDTGGGPTKSQQAPFLCFQTDDGTVGYLGNEAFLPIDTANVSYGSTTSPDEYGIIFQLPFKCKIDALFVRLGAVAVADTGVMALISAPTTAAADILTVSINAPINSAIAAPLYNIFTIPETELTKNTDYAITHRPDVAGVRSIRTYVLPFAGLRSATLLGTTLYGATRTDLAATFTTSTTVIPDVGFRISQIDDGTGTGVAGGNAAYLG